MAILFGNDVTVLHGIYLDKSIRCARRYVQLVGAEGQTAWCAVMNADNLETNVNGSTATRLASNIAEELARLHVDPE